MPVRIFDNKSPRLNLNELCKAVTVGAVVGGELDKKGSRTEGHVIGGLVGGTLGYIIGGALEKDNDLRRRYEGSPGEYVTHNGGAYRRHRNDEHGFVSIRISTDDPYYYGDGRKKSHPVFAEHSGRGKGKGLTKQKTRVMVTTRLNRSVVGSFGVEVNV